MASVASQSIEEVTAHAQSNSIKDAREICADGTYFLNKPRIYPPSNNACMSDPISPKASDKPVNSTEWTLVPTKNYFPNHNNNKHIAVPSNQTIKTANRFTFHNLEVENTVLHG